VRQGGEKCASAVIAEGATLARILNGDENPATAVRRGAIRAVGPSNSDEATRVQLHLDALLGELKNVVRVRQSCELAETELMEV
jgi:hypothetical protein